MDRRTFLDLLRAVPMIPFIRIERQEKVVPIKYYEYEWLGNKIRFAHNELLDGPLKIMCDER